MFTAHQKALLAISLLAIFLWLAPLNDKLLLLSILLVPAAQLADMIQARNSFWAIDGEQRSVRKMAPNPWVVILSVLLAWSIGMA